jgi:hypothetical protein
MTDDPTRWFITEIVAAVRTMPPDPQRPYHETWREFLR